MAMSVTEVAAREPVKARLVDNFFLEMYVYCGGLLPDKLPGAFCSGNRGIVLIAMGSGLLGIVLNVSKVPTTWSKKTR